MKLWYGVAPCGCILAASCDKQNKDDLALDIGSWILQGYTVKNVDGDVITVLVGHREGCLAAQTETKQDGQEG